jgi:hypothetical protein
LQQLTSASHVTPEATQNPPSISARQALLRHSPLQHAVPEKHCPPGSVQVLQTKLLHTSGEQQSLGDTQKPPSWQVTPPSPDPHTKLEVQSPEQHWLGAKQEVPVPRQVPPSGSTTRHCGKPLSTQLSPEAQTLLQKPQLLGSVVVSTQVPLQSVSPPEQMLTHMPPRQPVEGLQNSQQNMLQPPQLLLSVWVSTHWPLHRTVPPSHGLTQVLLVQLSPCGQHTPLQSVSPKPQLALQTALTQGRPKQSLPHCPQLCESVSVLTQKPPQNSSPEGQGLVQTSDWQASPEGQQTGGQ